MVKELLRNILIRLLTLPILIIEVLLSIVFVITHRAIERSKKIHLKLEYLEKYRNKKRRDKLERIKGNK